MEVRRTHDDVIGSEGHCERAPASVMESMAHEDQTPKPPRPSKTFDPSIIGGLGRRRIGRISPMLRTRWLTQKSIGCGNCHVRSLISSQRSTTSSSASCGRRASHSDQSWRSNPLRTAPMCVRLGAEATDPAPRCRSLASSWAGRRGDHESVLTIRSPSLVLGGRSPAPQGHLVPGTADTAEYR